MFNIAQERILPKSFAKKVIDNHLYASQTPDLLFRKSPAKVRSMNL